MIVKMGDQKLWVEGDQAYSVSDIKSRHSILTQKKEGLEANLKDVNAVIDSNINKKSELESNLTEVSCELDGVTTILNKILNAENASIVKPSITPAIAIVEGDGNISVANPEEVVANAANNTAKAVSPKRNFRIID